MNERDSVLQREVDLRPSAISTESEIYRDWG